LSVNEVGEFCRIADEEHRSVVEDPVHVTLLRPDLDGEASRITSSICTTALTTDGRETDSGASLRADLGEEGGGSEVGDVVGDFEVTMGASTLCMDDTLGNPLTIKVSEKIDMVEVL